MGFRRRGRQLALQALYQRDLAGESSISIEAFLRHFDAGEEVNEFAQTLVRGVVENEAAIDELIAEISEHWKFERLSKVDLNVLRLATFELLMTREVPVNVVINEAIEIARRFGTNESAVFVNGVLDAIARRIEAKSREQVCNGNG